MGVSNLWEALRPASERKPLSPLAASYYCGRPQRKLRIGVDASIWLKQCSVSVGSNPVYPHLPLQAFFYKLTALFNAGVTVLLVFDGPDRPKVKRGKFVRGNSMPNEKNVQALADAFGFNWVKAPAEAEAELAVLQRKGDIDLILSDDADTFVFGATWVMRNHSKNLSGTGAQAKHDAQKQTVDHEAFYTLFRAERILQETGLTHGGMVLVALMSGGDYEPAGVENCGSTVAHGMAKCGFGDELLTAYDNLRWTELDGFKSFLDDWRERLREELRSNSMTKMTRKAPTLAKNLPDTFPLFETLDNYIQPITTLNKPTLAKTFDWQRPFDMQGLVTFVTEKLIWDHQMFTARFRSERGIYAGLVLRDLIDRKEAVALNISKWRAHPSTGKQHEYRLEYEQSQYASQLQECLFQPDPNEERVQEMRAKAKAAGKEASEPDSEDAEEEPAATQSPTKGKKTTSKSLLWINAAVLRRCVPDMVEAYEQGKETKEEKKALAQETKGARERGEKTSPSKRKTSRKTNSKSIIESGSAPISPVKSLQPMKASTTVRRKTPQPSSPVSAARTSSSLEGEFFLQNKKAQPVAGTSRASSTETVIDLCSSPERSPGKHSRSNGNVSVSPVRSVPRVDKSPRKSRKQTSPKLPLPTVRDLDLSNTDADSDDMLPALPDPTQITVKAAPKPQTKPTGKTKNQSSGGTLDFRSTKPAVSSASISGKPAQQLHRNKPKPKDMPVYIDISD